MIYLLWPISETALESLSLALSHPRSHSLPPSLSQQTFVINIMATAALAAASAGNGNGDGRGDSKMAYTHCGLSGRGGDGEGERRVGVVHPQIVVSLCRSTSHCVALLSNEQ